MSSTVDPESNEPKIKEPTETEIDDPIGDETDGEGRTPVGDEKPEAPTEEDPEDEDAEDEGEDAEEPAGDEPELEKKPRPPAKLERLQKILAQAGIASRRKAEEMMAQGRVQVNGKVITEPGTKADMGRDHIRVDGKLLQGAERHRYFVLNKPKGFVTTVKDPEGRPTVMQFFEKMRERLYPVGRLDYMSEGLLVVTNDGELANKLTRAASGIEKTYLVKVAGRPTEAELDILRAGVAIDRGKAGEGKVRTAPARIRQVRQGDNPWYEVVLIEGRNRELRKMFEEVGHFVEKIRRVGYGPLILDQEPGNLRELDEQELEKLRKAADGKLRTPKAKELRRRNLEDATPTQTPLVETRTRKPFEVKREYKPKRSFEQGRPGEKTRPGGSKPARFGGPGGRAAAGRPGGGSPAWKREQGTSRPPESINAGPSRGERSAPRTEFGSRPPAGRSFGARPGARPGSRPGARPESDRPFAGKPPGRTFGGQDAGRKPFTGRPERDEGSASKPAWKKPEGREMPPGKRPFAGRPAESRRPAPPPVEDLGPTKRSRLHIEPVQDSPRGAFREQARPSRPASNRPFQSDSARGRGDSPRPFRGETGLPRPFTTSSGKPRAGGARPNNKPGGRPDAARPSFGSKRPFAGKPERREAGAPRSGGQAAERSTGERNTGGGWKPKPNFRGAAKPGGGRSSSSRRPDSGKPSFSKGKPAFKGKSGGNRGGKKRG
jgi:pseudouridine synthase